MIRIRSNTLLDAASVLNLAMAGTYASIGSWVSCACSLLAVVALLALVGYSW